MTTLDGMVRPRRHLRTPKLMDVSAGLLSCEVALSTHKAGVVA